MFLESYISVFHPQNEIRLHHNWHPVIHNDQELAKAFYSPSSLSGLLSVSLYLEGFGFQGASLQFGSIILERPILFT